jgi:hypothetical protein
MGELTWTCNCSEGPGLPQMGPPMENSNESFLLRKISGCSGTGKPSSRHEIPTSWVSRHHIKGSFFAVLRRTYFEQFCLSLRWDENGKADSISTSSPGEKLVSSCRSGLRMDSQPRISRHCPRVAVLSFVGYNQHSWVFQRSLHVLSSRATSNATALVVTSVDVKQISETSSKSYFATP